jgi:hypothetical protein
MSRKLPLVLLLTLAMALQGCGGIQPSSTSSDPAPTESEALGAKDTSSKASKGTTPAPDVEFSGLDDENLQRYLRDTLYTALVEDLDSDQYYVENVDTKYISKEYLKELAANSKENIYFGYTLSALEQQFQGTKYVFTVGDDGHTIVHAFEDYDDTYDRVVQNVAIGTGVILVCVTVSAVTGGVAPTVSMVFAVSAKTAAGAAVSGGAIGGSMAGISTAIRTGDVSKAIDAAALGGSEGFKWGAIVGAVTGGAGEFSALRGATRNGLTINEAATIQKDAKYPLEIIRRFKSMDEYNIYKDAGLEAKLVNGKSALVRPIDPTIRDGNGLTNIERMKRGLAALDVEGNPYELHHVAQEKDGILAILTKAEHRGEGSFSKLHDLMRGSEVDHDSKWAKEREGFWKSLAETLEK